MSSIEKQWQEEFVANSLYRMDESFRMISNCMASLEEEAIWQRPNASSNSIGNLILHLRGNITQYVISSLGRIEDRRERAQEFSASPGFEKEELLNMLKETVDKAKQCIRECSAEEFLKQRKVQGFSLSGLGAVLHAVEHFSYHTGQIAYWTKILTDRDLGFYRGIDLNIKND